MSSTAPAEVRSLAFKVVPHMCAAAALLSWQEDDAAQRCTCTQSSRLHAKTPITSLTATVNTGSQRFGTRHDHLDRCLAL